jgi:hypothetical protein
MVSFETTRARGGGGGGGGEVVVSSLTYLRCVHR